MRAKDFDTFLELAKASSHASRKHANLMKAIGARQTHVGKHRSVFDEYDRLSAEVQKATTEYNEAKELIARVVEDEIQP